MRPAAARDSTALRAHLQSCGTPLNSARRRDRSRSHIARRKRNKRQARRQEQAARRTDPRGTTGESHEGDLQESRRVGSENLIISIILEGYSAVVNGPVFVCLDKPARPLSTSPSIVVPREFLYFFLKLVEKLLDALPCCGWRRNDLPCSCPRQSRVGRCGNWRGQ